MNRRGFLKSILLAGVAPAFVPVERLMRLKPIVVPERMFLVCTSVDYPARSASYEVMPHSQYHEFLKGFIGPAPGGKLFGADRDTLLLWGNHGPLHVRLASEIPRGSLCFNSARSPSL